jgi:5-methylcytosine-specific restriction endonuclease McrA
MMMTRTANIYRHQKQRATKHETTLDYELDQVRAWLKCNPHCRYCGALITEKTFSLDHILPVSRQGSFSRHNIAVCCEGCNSLKGNLNEYEFTLLQQAIAKMATEAAQDIKRRLKAGARVFVSTKRKPTA